MGSPKISGFRLEADVPLVQKSPPGRARRTNIVQSAALGCRLTFAQTAVWHFRPQLRTPTEAQSVAEETTSTSKASGTLRQLTPKGWEQVLVSKEPQTVRALTTLPFEQPIEVPQKATTEDVVLDADAIPVVQTIQNILRVFCWGTVTPTEDPED